ncbi:MAG: isocitrate lyase/PEP mutase family protein [Myxococcota bacterium]
MAKPGSPTRLFPPATAGSRGLRARLMDDTLVRGPGVFDALSARVVEEAGFEMGFLGGFSLSAASLGLPDVGLLSYGEMIDRARDVCAATALPIFGDADTGYGNAVNVERTVLGAARVGLAGLMIEDQRWPKRCGHTAGKDVIDRAEALQRVTAAIRARDEHGLDLLIMARSDANATHGFDEALWRVEAFADAGADLTFLEAPVSREQLSRYGGANAAWKTASMVEDGKTPWLSPAELEDLGYSLVIYPVTLLLHNIFAMRLAVSQLAEGRDERDRRATFDDTRSLVGWPDYDAKLESLEGPMEGGSNGD